MSILELNANNFDLEVLKSDKPVLVDFWAAWCGPCRMLAPTVDAIADENPNVKVCKVNVDSEESLAIRFGIMSIPTLLFFDKGELKGQLMGVQPKQTILDLLNT